MKAGKSWLIFEEHFHTRERRLNSIVSPRKTPRYICDLMEQIYVDKFASIREKLIYKKDRKKSAFVMEKHEQRGPTIFSCGHEPVFRAYYCDSIELNGCELKFTYRAYRIENGKSIHSVTEDSIHLEYEGV